MSRSWTEWGAHWRRSRRHWFWLACANAGMMGLWAEIVAVDPSIRGWAVVPSAILALGALVSVWHWWRAGVFADYCDRIAGSLEQPDLEVRQAVLDSAPWEIRRGVEKQRLREQQNQDQDQ